MHFVVVEGGNENLQWLPASSKSLVWYDLISNVFQYIDTHCLGKYDSNGDYSAAMKHHMEAIQGHGRLSGLYQAILQAKSPKFWRYSQTNYSESRAEWYSDC
jgi:hypothetical protein